MFDIILNLFYFVFIEIKIDYILYYLLDFSLNFFLFKTKVFKSSILKKRFVFIEVDFYTLARVHTHSHSQKKKNMIWIRKKNFIFKK